MNLENIDRKRYEFIEADNYKYQYMGRIDFQNPKAPTMIYAGSNIRVKFSGTSLKIVIKNYHNHYENAIGYIIDKDIEGKVVIQEHNKVIVINIAEGLENKIHDLILYKRSDSAHYFDFYGLVLDKDCYLESDGENKERRIECFGD